jgi:hypothetical protein
MDARPDVAKGVPPEPGPSARSSPARAWVEAYAEHVRKRHGSRAVVSVRVAGSDALELSQIYALEKGGLILAFPDDPGEEPGGHHAGGHHGHAMPGPSDLDPRDRELWIASAEQAVFELRRAGEGELCTGFGYLGVSRTPRVLVPRGTEPPPEVDHHAHDEF